MPAFLERTGKSVRPSNRDIHIEATTVATPKVRAVIERDPNWGPPSERKPFGQRGAKFIGFCLLGALLSYGAAGQLTLPPPSGPYGLIRYTPDGPTTETLILEFERSTIEGSHDDNVLTGLWQRFDDEIVVVTAESDDIAFVGTLVERSLGGLVIRGHWFSETEGEGAFEAAPALD